ncbi:MAG: CPBP family intramembrane metalloprotease, partial [Phycisphaerales bacterium]
MKIEAVADEERSTRRWVISIVLALVGVVYISLFWGQAAAHLPAPFDRWALLLHPHLWLLFDMRPWVWLAAQAGLGMVLPALALAAFRRTPVDVGLGLPNVVGRRLVLVGVLVSIPFGFWLLWGTPTVQSSLALRAHDLSFLLVLIPEHFLISGVFVALMLPGRRLPQAIGVAPVEGRTITRALRWLGLAQPSAPGRTDRVLTWFGLTGNSLFAICVSGGLFCMVHVGKGPLELATSLPGGVVAAYITLRSHSIWPVVFAHWSMN